MAEDYVPKHRMNLTYLSRLRPDFVSLAKCHAGDHVRACPFHDPARYTSEQAKHRSDLNWTKFRS